MTKPTEKRRRRKPARDAGPAARAGAAAVETAARRAELAAQNEQLRSAQRELEDSRNRYADLFDFSPLPYLILDASGMIRDINLTAAGVLGLRRSQASGMPFIGLVPPEHHARFRDHMERCRRGANNLSTDLELRIRGNRRLAVCLVTAPNARCEQNEFRTAIVDLRDRQQLAEQQAALIREQARREEAERSDRSKDELLAILAHDLRGPLSAIDTWTHLLSTDRLGPDERQRAIDVIERNVQAQAALINEMLEVSRIIRGTVALERVEIDLLRVMQGVIEAAAPLAAARRVRLETHLDPIASPIAGDPERIRHVFASLLASALQSTPAGGRVQVRLERALWRAGAPATESSSPGPGECARVTVHDSGAGLTAEELPHAFERFWQPRSDRTAGGTGLGPAIVRRLVELHGGRVHAASEGPGHGVTLTIELPLERTVPAARAETVPARRRGLEGVRVLVVDDQPESLEQIRSLLEPFGVRIESSRSAAEAIEILRRLHPDVLIAGFGTADEDGLSLIRSVRQLAPADGGATPAIAVCRRLPAQASARMISAGFETFLARPVNGRRLGALIARLTASGRDPAD